MRKQYILYIAVILLSFVNITLCSSSIFYNTNASALNYQTSTNIGFTFRPTLNVSLSNNNLVIDNLIPGGEAKDSNIATINVSTNIAEGYNLFATVGSDSSNNANNGYNTTNLVNTVNNDYTLTSLSSNIPNLNSFTNNNWGYSYSLDSGTTWISGDYDNASNGYNGLPLYTNTGVKLVEEVDNTSSTVDFKIAAKASNTQPSGEYTNTINFTAISNIIPTTMLDAFIASGAQMYKGYFKMQDMTPTICKSIDTDEEKGMQLIDVRDDKVYWVAKLKDGNCWMTQNLDLDLSHEVALTSDDTDISADTNLYVQSSSDGPYALDSGYAMNTIDGKTIVSWTPERDTITYNDLSSTTWQNDNNHPYSYDHLDSNGDPVYPDNLATKEIAGNHGLSGNYYNWSAAIASNNSTHSHSEDTNNSICPKNWRLPSTAYKDLSNLLVTQDVIETNTSTTYLDDGFSKINSNPLYFIRSGYVWGGSIYVSGSYGDYWYKVLAGATIAYRLRFNDNKIWPEGTDVRNNGSSIRCLAE